MGKPMANGIPCSALAGKSEILASFSEKFPYFNTFAGNPVSMAASLAVLKFIKDEDILSHTKKVGAELLSALKEVQSRHSGIVGDVRGSGLFIGFELVGDAQKKTPDKERTLRLIDLMYERKVLTSNCGTYGNVLKIRPPLVFQSKDIDWFCCALDESLSVLEAGR